MKHFVFADHGAFKPCRNAEQTPHCIGSVHLLHSGNEPFAQGVRLHAVARHEWDQVAPGETFDDACQPRALFRVGRRGIRNKGENGHVCDPSMVLRR